MCSLPLAPLFRHILRYHLDSLLSHRDAEGEGKVGGRERRKEEKERTSFRRWIRFLRNLDAQVGLVPLVALLQRQSLPLLLSLIPLPLVPLLLVNSNEGCRYRFGLELLDAFVEFGRSGRGGKGGGKAMGEVEGTRGGKPATGGGEAEVGSGHCEGI
jgi:hypothetical protein